MEMCALPRISIGLQLMRLITFPFYCVKEEVMKMAETHTRMIKFGVLE